MTTEEIIEKTKQEFRNKFTYFGLNAADQQVSMFIKDASPDEVEELFISAIKQASKE